MKLTPKDSSLAATLTEVRAGRFTNQYACEALRDDLASQHPGFKRGLDVIQDLRELLSQEAASQAPPPAPPPAVTVLVPAPRVLSAEDTLLAEYEAAQSDPKALSALLNHPEKGPKLRALAFSARVPDRLIADAPSTAVDERQPVTAELLQLASKPAPLSDLAGIYEKVRHSPAALSRFLETNRAAVRDLITLVEA